jgi:hypothetical protein
MTHMFPCHLQLHPNPNLVNPDPDVDLGVVVGKKALDHPVRGPRDCRPLEMRGTHSVVPHTSNS